MVPFNLQLVSRPFAQGDLEQPSSLLVGHGTYLCLLRENIVMGVGTCSLPPLLGSSAR